MISNILQFICYNSSKELFSRKKSSRIEKNTRIMQKNHDKVKSIFSVFLVFSRVGINFPNMEKFEFFQLINYQLIN